MTIIQENARRLALLSSAFDPLTGEGSVGERRRVSIADHPRWPVQWLPLPMMDEPLVRDVVAAGSIKTFLEGVTCGRYRASLDVAPSSAAAPAEVEERLFRLRLYHDFPFWAASLVKIKDKRNGPDIPLVLNRPQRRLVALLERRRLEGKPIRVIIVKARQWGGSTCVQMYMAWMQLQRVEGINSLIVGHQNQSTSEVKDMFDKMIRAYPLQYLHPMGHDYKEGEKKLEGVGTTRNIFRVPQRNCKIKLGSAESPDSTRGSDSALIHCTEVGLWRKTDNKTPEQIVRAACGSTPLLPNTMIVYESTANGTGNFFHREYLAAKDGNSNFDPLFVAWWQIELYSLPFASEAEREAFARRLEARKDESQSPRPREESGRYYWRLWEAGATLEALHWYETARRQYDDHGDMASEYPSDDIEAFVFSGTRVFDRYKVELLRRSCQPPRWVGEVVGDGVAGRKALAALHFVADPQGSLWVWRLPERWEDAVVTHRYLVVVDVGGRSKKSDWSVICVFDRYWLKEGGKPSVVAQWYGHIDMDLLAWKAAQVARFYDNALLVIESNTLETHDPDRDTDGDQTGYILSQIKAVYANLYARPQSDEDIAEGVPVKYGFHTNVATKPLIISELVRVIRDSLYVERDSRCLDEYLQYEKRQNGSFGAIQGAHDDLLMTRAIGLRVCFAEMPMPRVVERQRQSSARQRPMTEATI